MSAARFARKSAERYRQYAHDFRNVGNFKMARYYSAAARRFDAMAEEFEMEGD
jgi:hypothetical protein